MGIREEQYLQRKEQILQIALEEFINKGYFGTSTREIAKIAGMSSGLLFHYFESKQALYEELVRIGCAEMIIEYTKEDNPFAVFEREINSTLSFVAKNPFVAKMFVFMGDASYNAGKISQKAGEMLAEHNVMEQSIPLLKKGQKMGVIRQGDARVLSIAFWSSVQGIVEAIAMNPMMSIPKAEWILDIIKP